MGNKHCGAATEKQFSARIWGDGCFLDRLYDMTEWEGPTEELVDQLKRRKGTLVLVQLFIEEGEEKCPSCPVIETIEDVQYIRRYDYNPPVVVDFPREVLRLPRLQSFRAFGVHVNSIPAAILDTPVKELDVHPRVVPAFLVESSVKVNWTVHWLLEPFKHLRQLLLLGLGEEEEKKPPTPWSSFLKQHRLHDPRLFLFVAEFLK